MMPGERAVESSIGARLELCAIAYSDNRLNVLFFLVFVIIGALTSNALLEDIGVDRG